MDGTVNRSTGRFVCFEGIDGAGKSTVAEQLVLALRRNGIKAILVSRSSHPNDRLAAERLCALENLLWNYPPEAQIKSLGDRHLILLMASWYHLFDEWVVRPALRTNHFVVTDQWINKYIARFRVKQAFWASPFFDGLTRPDRILLLDVAPNIAAGRKIHHRFTESEWGFINFQSKVATELGTLQDGSWRTINADTDLRKVVDIALEIVLEIPKKEPC